MKSDVLSLSSYINPFLGIWVVGTSGACFVERKFSNKSFPDRDQLSAILRSQLEFTSVQLDDATQSIQVLTEHYSILYKVYEKYAIIGISDKKHSNSTRITTILGRIAEEFQRYFCDYLTQFEHSYRIEIFELFEPKIDEIFSKLNLVRNLKNKGKKKILEKFFGEIQ